MNFSRGYLASLCALLCASVQFGHLASHAAYGAAADEFGAQRERMVSEQIQARGVRDRRVLAAMRQTLRHLFVGETQRPFAYDDRPLLIGGGQTISQPYIVARMTELARPQPSDRVLEIGTGSGYQAAVLSPLVAEVYSIEIDPELAAAARRRLRELGYRNITVRAGDGYLGWPESAPFDIIVVTAAPDHVPQPLLEQLKPGGRLVLPVGHAAATQELRLIEKNQDGKLRTSNIIPVRFVPLRRLDRAGGS